MCDPDSQEDSETISSESNLIENRKSEEDSPPETSQADSEEHTDENKSEDQLENIETASSSSLPSSSKTVSPEP